MKFIFIGHTLSPRSRRRHPYSRAVPLNFKFWNRIFFTIYCLKRINMAVRRLHIIGVILNVKWNLLLFAVSNHQDRSIILWCLNWTATITVVFDWSHFNLLVVLVKSTAWCSALGPILLFVTINIVVFIHNFRQCQIRKWWITIWKLGVGIIKYYVTIVSNVVVV